MPGGKTILAKRIDERGEGCRQQQRSLNAARGVPIGKKSGGQRIQLLAQQSACCGADGQHAGGTHIQRRFSLQEILADTPRSHGDDGAAGQKGNGRNGHQAGCIQHWLDDDTAAHTADCADDAGEKGNQIANGPHHRILHLF